MAPTVASARTRAFSYATRKSLTAGSVATSGDHFAAQPFREQPEILNQFGSDAEDMAAIDAARPIEAVCMLWCMR